MRRARWLLVVTQLACVRLPLYGGKSLESAQVEAFEARFDDTRGDFTVKLRVDNPHLWGGHLREVDWEVWLDGRWFAAGVQQISGDLVGSGHQELRLTLPFVHARPNRVRGDSLASVGVRGQVQADFGAGSEGLVFSRILTMPLPGRPADARDRDGA